MAAEASGELALCGGMRRSDLARKVRVAHRCIRAAVVGASSATRNGGHVVVWRALDPASPACAACNPVGVHIAYCAVSALEVSGSERIGLYVIRPEPGAVCGSRLHGRCRRGHRVVAAAGAVAPGVIALATFHDVTDGEAGALPARVVAAGGMALRGIRIRLVTRIGVLAREDRLTVGTTRTARIAAAS